MMDNFLKSSSSTGYFSNSIGSFVTTLNKVSSVVYTLPCSTRISNSLTISVRHKCVATFPTATSLIVSFFFHILTITKFKHVTSTYYHGCSILFEFTFNVTFIGLLIFSVCVHS